MFPRLLPMVRALLIANGVVFLLQNVLPDGVLAPFVLWGINLTGNDYAYPGFTPWQLLTAGFMHGDFMHLLFNMLALWMFGSPLEATWGEKRFLTFFLVCLIGANLCELVVLTLMMQSGAIVPALGASGGVYGLLLGFAMLFPNQRMIVFPFPMEIRARTLVIIYGALALFYGISGSQAGVAHFAHLGGMVFGWLMIRYWRGHSPFGKRRPPGPRMRIVK